MADEDPSETSPAAENLSIPKKETVRINLPPNPEETPMVKRETVRINTPGAPKKETTSIGGAMPLPSVSDPYSAPPPPPSATRPLIPPPAPPPRPPSAPGIPGAARPGMPPIAQRPGIPTSAAPKVANPEVKPVTIKASPKKETARIQVAPTMKLPPQQTVRLAQPTQNLSSAPAPALRAASAPAATVEVASTGNETVVNILSWAAMAFALVAAGLSYWAYSYQP